MKIVFWNIKQNKNMAYVVDLIDRVKPDLLFLAECPQEIDWSLSRYEVATARIFTNPKVRGFIVSSNVKCSLRHEYKNRLFLYRLTWQDKDFLLGTVHLLPKNHASSDTQSLEAKDYVREVRLVEKDEQQKNTILIGDFNMNPFDPGMISASTFNSVCSPAIALKRCRTFQWESYDYFFNPTWKNYAGVGKDIYGTYYHHSCGADEFHWNNFDQALVSPSILQQYNPEFSILHDVLRFDLRKENNGISDHYPILLELKEK